MLKWFGIPEAASGGARWQNLAWLLLSMIIVWVDQISKRWAADYLSGMDGINIWPGFDFSLAHNFGAAFSFLSDKSGWQFYFFVTVALLLSSLLLTWLVRVPRDSTLTLISLALILGGAWGNLIDRLLHGYVIDFIMLYYKAWVWPTFNIADSAICIGAALLILVTWREERQQKET